VGLPVLYTAIKYFGRMPDHLAKLPSTWELFKQFSLSFMVMETTFYFAHRAFHHGPLCRLISQCFSPVFIFLKVDSFIITIILFGVATEYFGYTTRLLQH
jgi:hypothetical protein